MHGFRNAIRTELACARALLDELESLLETDEPTRRDVIFQAADQLARLADAMRGLAASHDRDDRVQSLESPS